MFFYLPVILTISMDYKLIFAIISTIIGTASFVPYFRDILRRKTKPHVYTWLIWALTQGTATFAIIHGGGGIGALEFVFGTTFVFIVFLFSLKYGSKNITKSDTFLLIVALIAILVWWQLNNPVLSVVMICVIDVLGYIPSYRKCYEEPWSETLITWISFVVGNMLALAALREYNILTMSYIVTISIANTALFILCIVRRRTVLKPN